MKRRDFLRLTGLAAGAVTFHAVLPSQVAAVVTPSLPGATGKTISVICGDESILEEEFLRVGDIFTVSGRYAIDPITRGLATHLQKFVVTAVEDDRVAFVPASQMGRISTR